MSSLNDLAQQINDNAKAKGFWESDRNFGEMLMLATSELSEALEEHRAGRPAHYLEHAKDCPYNTTARTGFPAFTTGCPHCTPKPEGVAVELADCLIRVLDTMHSLHVDIDGVVAEKMAYNASRPHKHGKAY